MANEFKIKHGFISLGNAQIEGTLNVSTGINIDGDVVATRNWITTSALTGYATQTYVTTAIANLVASAPGTLDTLNELAAALGDDPNFATTVTNSIATKLPLAGGTLSGTLTINADEGLKVAYSGGGHTWIRGWGFESDRGAVYLRPTTNNTQTLLIGYPEGAKNWGTVLVGAAGFTWNGETVATRTWTTSQGYQAASTAITTSNIGSQSVNFANSSTSAAYLNYTSVGGTQLNANTFGYGRASNYYGTGQIANSPENAYASLYNFGGTNESALSLQMFASVNHNDTASTRNLWFRVGNNLGFQNDWKQVIHSGNIGSQSVSYATTAGSLTSMNISQFTNNSGYITGYTETDTLATVTNRGNSTSQNLVFSNGRKGLVGVYDAAQTQAIFAMGASYVLTDGGGSGTIGNHYGLAWSYNPNYGGSGNNPQSKAGLEHQLLVMNAGVTQTAIGSGIWTAGLITTTSYGTSANWNTAYGWGNHASAGYITSLPSHNHDDRYFQDNKGSISLTGSNPFDDSKTETQVTGSGSYVINYTGASAHLFSSNVGGSASMFQIGAHYNGSDFYMRTRTDSTSWNSWKQLWHSGDFSSTNISNWNTAYGWGNHATAGYSNASNLSSGTVPYARTNKVLPTSGNYVWNASTPAGDYEIGVQTSFVNAALGFPEYGAVLHIGARGATDAGGDFQIYCGHGSGNGGNHLRFRNADNNANPSDSWTAFKIIWDSENLVNNQDNWNTAYSWGNHGSQGYATQTYVNTAVSNLVSSAPGTLDTLNELAAALGDDPNFATTVTNSIAGKLSLAGGTMTGDIIFNNNIRLEYSTTHWITPRDSSGNMHLHTATGGIYLDAPVIYIRERGSESNLITIDNGTLTATGTISATGGNSTQWNTAYGWGNHASAGYLTAEADTLSTVLARGATSTQSITSLDTNGTSLAGLSVGETFADYNGWNTQLNVHGAPHSRLNVKTSTVRMGVYAHNSWHSISGSTLNGHVGTYTNHGLGFLVNASPKMVINTSGQVGINQTSPTSQLDVGGIIAATGGNSTNWNTAYTVANAALPKAGGTLSGNLITSGSGNYVLIGGAAANNAYNTVASTTGLMFGGANDPYNYSIGTTMQNIGGNYTKLNIKWHTGLRFFSMPQYGGARFYSDAAMNTETFSINNLDGHVRVANNLYVGSTVTATTFSGALSGNAATATQWGTAAGYANFSSTAISSGVGWVFGTTGNGTYAPVSISSVSSLLNLSGTNTGDQTNISGNAATATNVAWTGVTSRPTALSQFSNDLGNYGGWLTTGGKAADSELIDGIDSSRIIYGDGSLGSTSYSDMNNTAQKSGFFFYNQPTGNPFGDWTHWINCMGNSWNPNYGFQLAHAFHSNNFAVRVVANGGFSSWRTIIDSGNIGSQSVSYATTAGTANAVAWTNVSSRPTALSQFTNDLGNYGGWITGINSGNVTTALGFTPYNATNPSGYITSSASISGNAATATYATTAGSAPANGGNSTTVGGYAVSGSVGANTVVIRDANNYIYAHYINSNVSETENPTINSFYTSNGDGWLRKSSVAHVKGQLGLGSAAYVATSTFAAAAHDHDRSFITDSRGSSRAPSYYDDRYAQWDFQNVSDTGVGGDGWHALLTVSKWASFDASHRQEQLIFSGDHLWRRTATSDSAWGTNKKIYDSGNLTLATLGYTGATNANYITNNNQLTNGAGYITTGGRAYPRRSDGGDLNFYWSGQSGQPTWLWGGTDGANMYVYNPSNFSVNYATTAGSAATTAAFDDGTLTIGGGGFLTWDVGPTRNMAFFHNGSTGAMDYRTEMKFRNQDGIEYIRLFDFDYWTGRMTLNIDAYNQNNGLGNNGGDCSFAVDADNHVAAIRHSGVIQAVSDRREKHQILPIKNAVERVKKITGSTYYRTNSEHRLAGVIAQDVQEALPEAVWGSEETRYSVDYNAIIALLVQATKEQQETIDALTERIQILENK